MNLSAYFERIKYDGTPRVDVETLCDIHRHHLLAIPYEDIDVQLKRPLTTSVEAAYDKIVNRGRGGWCYEMNGLLGWALTEIGFKIQRISAGVNRNERGDDAMGTHLVLLCEVDEQTYVVDAGFGDGFLNPPRLEAGVFSERGFDFRFELLADGHWRMHNHTYGGAPSFDFMTDPASEARLSDRCEHLQTDAQSSFVLVLIVQLVCEDGYEIQVGRVAKRVSATGVETRLLQSSDELVARLKSVFGLDVPEVAELWPTIVARHEQLFGAAAT